MSADPFTPAVVAVQRDARDRDDTLAAAVVCVWDLLLHTLDLSGDAKPEDPGPIRALRVQLESSGRRDWAEKTRLEMDAAHQAARRQAGVPSYDHIGDGTRARPIGDETDQMFERDRLLGASSQVARHQKMATAGGWVGDATDRPDTRPIREEIYRKLREEGR